MARTVFCKKYQQELEGLDLPPMPGAKGKELFDTVSKKAWQEWLNHQTMLINEKRLNLMDPDTRTYLTEQMDKFLSNESVDKAEGYIPPSEK
ncbi:oxidative damage protection protein [Hahella sp. CCB-MM4]|uniref:oxidative damage protection protein n=1 Tax=Hahella sp. (strain CCB-MM4) TaxID=1926491 RepID=UPI000B9C57AB|nr:oxidative damage protection protein [Hahella sp. CCB-MM4]OZG71849.1 oxidative damage protection protein [Hahella sp. CCB-MM4]